MLLILVTAPPPSEPIGSWPRGSLRLPYSFYIFYYTLKAPKNSLKIPSFLKIFVKKDFVQARALKLWHLIGMAPPYPNTLDELLKSGQNLLLTDGAARGNPGPAGWAYILLSGEKNYALEGIGNSPKDTNNRMEMLGALRGLEAVKKLGLQKKLFLITDSNFIIDALKKWRHAWKRNNWIKSDGNPVLSTEIWKELDPLYDLLKPELFHIEAHKGHPGNTRCDLLAVAAATNAKDPLYEGSLSDYPHFKKIAFSDVYPSARYLCWKAKEQKVFTTWPEAQNFMAKNAGFRAKKIFSPEEIDLILKN